MRGAEIENFHRGKTSTIVAATQAAISSKILKNTTNLPFDRMVPLLK